MKDKSANIDWETVIIVGFITLVALGFFTVLALMVLHGDGSRVTEIMK